ncbi:MAG: chemotaxis protein CheX, partial [Dehalococcoidia bacterium]|nr:chemotaxis protein CheX [Dehalococcoidia bacterium]
MRAELINPVVLAAYDVMEHELGATPTRGALRLDRGAYATADVNTMIGVTGSVRGVIFLGLTSETARLVAARMLDCDVELGDPLAESGIAEMANMIAGKACMALAKAGHRVDISTPTVLLGRGSRVSTVNLPRICIPFDTNCGVIELQVALQEA